jgi:hypothetical protein
VLRNCPFDAPARQHIELVCGMNLAIMDAATERLQETGRAARLEQHRTDAVSSSMPADTMTWIAAEHTRRLVAAELVNRLAFIVASDREVRDGPPRTRTCRCRRSARLCRGAPGDGMAEHLAS